jgi:hypothetical protein
MNIQVININGDSIALSPQVKTALDGVGEEADKLNANWEELSEKVFRILKGDGFDIARLQPEIKYYETKKGKKTQSIRIFYNGLN